MNRLPDNFLGDPDKWKKDGDDLSPLPVAKPMRITETWEKKLCDLKDAAFKKFLEENYPDKVFTPEEIKRNGHIQLPEKAIDEEILMWQGRPVLHFKWSNKKKTLEVKEL